LKLFTDAFKTFGYGACYGTKWLSGNWLDSVSHHNISLLEIYPIFLAISIWGHELSNKCIILKCDNLAVVYIINKNTSKDKNIMTILRKIILL
jgi:hypothetical protein